MTTLEAFAIRDEEGSFVLDGGYLSFVCEENGNTIRIDPEQFDFENESEPFAVQVDDDTYNLYFTKDKEPKGNENQDNDSELLETYLSASLNEVEENSTLTGDCQDINNELIRFKWDVKSTQLLLKFYKRLCPNTAKNNRVLIRKRVWQIISNELRKRGYNYTPSQVSNRWKTLRRAGGKVMRKKSCTARHTEAQWGVRTNRYKGQLAEILNKNGSVLNLLINDSLHGSPEKIKLSKFLEMSGKDQVSNNLSHKSNMDMQNNAGSSQRLFNEETLKKNQNIQLKSDQGINIWDRKSTESLIHLHKKLSPFFGSSTCGNEKKLWEKLSYELAFSGYCFTAEQVEKKWTTLLDIIKSKKKDNEGFNKKEVVPKTPPQKKFQVLNSDLHNVTFADEVLNNKTPAFLSSPQTSSQLRPILPKTGNSSETMRSKWNDESTNLLVELYEKLSPFQGKTLLYPTRNILFKKICEELKKRGNYYFTPLQVENKWHTLERGLYSKIHRNTRREETIISPLNKKNFESADSESEAEVVSRVLLEKELSEEKRAPTLKSQKWNRHRTKLLFDLYKKHIPLLGVSGPYQTKLEMWKAISLDFLAQGYKFTIEQLANKWQSLERSLRNKLLKLTNNERNESINISSLRDQLLEQEMEDSEVAVLSLNDSAEESSSCEEVVATGNKSTAASSSHDVLLLRDNLSRNRSMKARNHKMPDNSKTLVISECLKRLTEAKEKYYKRRIELKQKTLKVLEERNIEIKRTNELLEQFLTKNDPISQLF